MNGGACQHSPASGGSFVSASGSGGHVGSADGVVGSYGQRDVNKIPHGFGKVCKQMGWPVEVTWTRLCDQALPWFEHENGSYIYRNTADGQWWIDAPSGGGVYVVQSTASLPPRDGWKALPDYGKQPLPQLEIVEK